MRAEITEVAEGYQIRQLIDFSLSVKKKEVEAFFKEDLMLFARGAMRTSVYDCINNMQSFYDAIDKSGGITFLQGLELFLIQEREKFDSQPGGSDNLFLYQIAQAFLVHTSLMHYKEGPLLEAEFSETPDGYKGKQTINSTLFVDKEMVALFFEERIRTLLEDNPSTDAAAFWSFLWDLHDLYDSPEMLGGPIPIAGIEAFLILKMEELEKSNQCESEEYGLYQTVKELLIHINKDYIEGRRSLLE
ncbi:MAG: hypothetical protein UT66_C0035G0022 [candidate division CPR2 bacterium GW2011_GWC1_39_9]|uniref:Uncharacterized protein n=1 Tax=candidate division CPR2 bacterium GW2011_GWC2_39_10 TaxID=1618345 RepID=A0A0G0P6H4_UNCC2|nr:MAG: hypothetical protein UT18_C0016G0005 [candidate division CPR2 bacterium GW2011_GWC2_39_10]KKR33689.1 MAG: hypothetical protein UT66_C0035G0022 [candidate division CPR2 bacterium GW2011_GWC1_39_9]